MRKSSAIKSTSAIMLLMIVSKITGFLRDVLIASAFGTTYQTDAYNMALIIPSFIFSVFGAAISTTFIPILSDIYKNKGKKEMYSFSNNVMTILMIITFVLCILGICLSPILVKILAPNFTGKTYELTVILSRIAMINLIFMSLNSGFTAILQTLEDFVGPALIGIVLNIPIIIYVLMGNDFGIYGLIGATVIGNGLQILVQVPWLIKHSYKYKVKFNINDKRLKKLLYLVIPVVIGTGVNQINSLIDKMLGSGLPEGSISALNFSSKVNGLVYSIFASAVVTVVYPMLSKEGTNHDKNKFKNYISKSISNIFLIIVPATIGMIILNKPIIEFIFMRGAFNTESVDMTAYALMFLSIGVVFYGTRDVFNRAFYSLQDTKTPMINGVLGVLINIILNLILVKYMGIGGLALATSISAAVTSILLHISLNKKIGSVINKKARWDIVKIIMSSIIMGSVTYFYYNFVVKLNMISNSIVLFSSIFVGILCYGICIIILKPSGFNYFMNIIKSKLKITNKEVVSKE